MEEIKFGIVISTYKRKDGKTPFYLNRTLESIFKQSYQNFKVFLIGDKYTDTDEFDLFGNQFEPQKIYKENLETAPERDKYNNNMLLWKYGGLTAFNYGIDLALKDDIEYIIKLDHDDWFEPSHLKNFYDCIKETSADFMCSKSTHIRGVLPAINSDKKYVDFLPASGGLCKSSHCMNYSTIPLRSRNLQEETGNPTLPGDADLWNRVKEHIQKNNLKSFMVNEITCHHDEEGFIKVHGK
jgi:glycosyltransferase involved in cell wall biosynthesis